MKSLTPEELIGAASRDYRLALGMTQGELARELGAAGWPSPSQSAVAELESGRRKTDWEDWFTVANVLEVAPLALLDIPPSAEVAIDVGPVWMSGRQWRTTMSIPASRTSSEPEKARVLARRQRNLGGRGKYPGPTYLASNPLTLHVRLPRYGFSVNIHLEPNIPWTARDELEARQLDDAESVGIVRRVDRLEARRMRRSQDRGRDG